MIDGQYPYNVVLTALDDASLSKYADKVGVDYQKTYG